MRRRALACICCLLVAMAMAGGEAHAATSSPAQEGDSLVGGSALLSDALVYADGIEAGSGSELAIPVKIWGNAGLMGFRISVSYDPDVLTVTNVASAQLTSEGLFNNSLGQKSGTFDVVWSAAEAAAGDGALFTLYAKAAETFEGATTVALAYDQADTFDGEFEDVKLTCNDIAITFDADGWKQVLDTDPVAEYLATEIGGEVAAQLDGEVAASVIDDALAANGVDSISDLTDAQAQEVLEQIVQRAKDAGLDTAQTEALLERAKEALEADLDADAASVYKQALEQLYQTAAEEAEGPSVSVSEALGESEAVASGAAEASETAKAADAVASGASGAASDAGSAAGDSREDNGPGVGVVVVVVLVVAAIAVGAALYARRNRGREK